MPEPSSIRRGFADLPNRQVHYRASGKRPTLLMLHGSPGSSRQLVPLIQSLAPDFGILAPDTPGYGDSPAMPGAGLSPDIAAFAAATLEFLDTMGVEQIDVYGSHTGGAIAVELALIAPARVRHLIVDGAGHFSPEDQADYLANYAPTLAPDRSGAYLATAFSFIRDVFLFWPWYKPDAAHRRNAGLPDAATLHALLLEVLKNLDTFATGYRAAFAYPIAERLAMLSQRILLMAQEGDPLLPHTQNAAALVRTATFATAPRAQAAHLISSFLKT